MGIIAVLMYSNGVMQGGFHVPVWALTIPTAGLISAGFYFVLGLSRA